MSAPYDSLPPRFQQKIQFEDRQTLVDGPCWIWTGATSDRGYGRVQVDYRLRYSHRIVYGLLVGEISSGLQLDHLCRVTTCCNPDHLEPVTPKVNSRRGVRATRTHCLRAGHPLSGDNLRVHTDRNGYEHRVCRECNRQTAAKWQRERAKRQQATWDKYLGDEQVAS